MRPNAKEIVKIVFVGFAVMMAVPAAYRVWLMYHPQPERQRTSLSEYLEKSAAANEVRLLMTPLSDWTSGEAASKPRVHAWLLAHERTVLPWEWTDEARRKDPEGYLKLWRKLFEECRDELKAKLEDEEGRLKALDREIEVMTVLYSHRTNQLSRIAAVVATNSFPMTLSVERKRKGRLWGWNTRTEYVTFAGREDYDSSSRGWATAERREADDESARIEAKFAERRTSVARGEALDALRKRSVEVLKSLSDPPAASSDMLVRDLLALIVE